MTEIGKYANIELLIQLHIFRLGPYHIGAWFLLPYASIILANLPIVNRNLGDLLIIFQGVIFWSTGLENCVL